MKLEMQVTQVEDQQQTIIVNPYNHKMEETILTIAGHNGSVVIVYPSKKAAKIALQFLLDQL